MKKKYRIVTDSFLGYEVQVKFWFWPFWVQCRKASFTNTFSTVKEAEQWVADGLPKDNQFKIIKYL